MNSQFNITDELITYSNAIRLALGRKMEQDKKIIVYGLGVDDPKAMYQTLAGFQLFSDLKDALILLCLKILYWIWYWFSNKWI